VRRPVGASRAAAGRLPPGAVALLRAELRSDGADRDVTTRALLPSYRAGRAVILAERSGVLSGAEAVARLARSVGLKARRSRRDGARLRPGDVVLELTGDARTILGTERTLLNALMHLSGVATATAQAVAAVRSGGGRVEVFATRKTLPGLRDLEKAAVVHGGGYPHRRDLADGRLIKGNHRALVPVPEAIARLRRRGGRAAPIQVEVATIAEAQEAVDAGAQAILVDNLPPARLRAVVAAVRARPRGQEVWIEASGGITLRTARRFAATGVDAVSLGALTHSAPALPFHLRWRLPAGPPPA
jgi:nicotinate-nucleotide pyrophosphorylase (carboxylating)